jgi:hypothetical protein
VCHLPLGTSKWNRIEHWLFSHITMNWRGRPLTSHEVIVRSIAATTSRGGLRVHAAPDTGTYPTGVRIADADMATLPLTRHPFHGDWNYTLHPRLAEPCPSTDGRILAGPWGQALLSDPALTGMSTQHLNALTEALTALEARIITLNADSDPKIKPAC